MVNQLTQPNFFIIGAPKCGTTSLSSWLSAHPSIFMCSPKEPYFFSQDIHSIRAVQSMADYEALFEGAKDTDVAIGEASTTYLRSQVAVPAILKCFPDARFIVCLRNPIEMVASVHMQLYQGATEPERSLQKAWALQRPRQQGEQLPTFCIDPNNLQYGEACSLGKQVERLLKQVSREQVLFIFLEDFRKNTREEYLKVLSFIGVPDDGRTDFPVENQRSEPRLLVLRRFAVKLNHAKHRLGIHRTLGIGALFRKVNQKKIVSQPLPNERFICELREYFTHDIQKLSDLVDRNLSGWLRQ
ncbi:MAG: sulfotransferase [Cyanobacteria bacterium J06555_13]